MNAASGVTQQDNKSPLWLVVGGRQPTSYRFAGRRLLADTRIDALGALFVASEPEVAPPPEPQPALPEIGAAVYRGPGWVGGRMAQVECVRSDGAFLVRVDELPVLRVDRDGCAAIGAPCPPAHAAALAEAALGPGLILALALRDVFTLHAGAFTHDGGAVVLLGESGAGKSTLARALSQAPGSTFVADDVLPVEIATAGPAALPHFPQLKLPAAAQYGVGEPERVPVRAIYELCGVSEPGAEVGVTIEPVERRDAVILLAGHTVAARLFDAPLLERHLAFCAALAATAPVRRLRFPQRLDALPEIIEAIAVNTENL